MDKDEINDAFARWKAAHDDFLVVEQRLFEAFGTGANQFPSKIVHASDPLYIVAQSKRAHAEELLLTAMKLLHEHRHPPGTQQSSD